MCSNFGTTECSTECFFKWFGKEEQERKVKCGFLAILCGVGQVMAEDCWNLVGRCKDVLQGIETSLRVITVIEICGDPLAKHWQAKILRYGWVHQQCPVSLRTRKSKDYWNGVYKLLLITSGERVGT